MQIFKTPNINFFRWRWQAVGVSALVILAGLGTMWSAGGVPLGIDFSGGTAVVIRFADTTPEDAVRAAIAAIPGEKVVQQYGDPSANEVLIRLPQIDVETGADLEQGATAIVDAIEAAGLGEFEVQSTDIVGPVIGRDLQQKGIYATLAALTGILIYISVRFRFSFALGAIAAVFHDILVTVAFLAFFGYELSLNVVAAILTITGYSVNDTIVIFDRVRENLRSMRRERLELVVNKSVNQTLARTIITSGTTSLTVLALFLFGGEVLRGFAFTMLVGIVSGTYSTVFIAAATAVFMSERQAAQRAAVLPAAGGGGSKRSRRRKMKARAS
ncbi:MAG: protein translocase subunit SecF [Vicinamibacterales bacterium]|jgi:preprotein translocase subunit SecF|nr:protein translocase subunit SecF [Acidobacteriota bacterium]MDP7293710.1 protein translocase subunit SecF [Vicinamibacterales bacterium]MDP7473131.1 protein translocase subunit SecF [Vicinamibacterales bacterium]MDP7672060.1 protein translocase subunit SecF [Vicinamibacterales bacterium]HJO39857.1 protein translocase subunit SecF [Vicinamibacterales bacterium]|tara:strand:+ start:3115 stop:4101 length:987 start_codon:yes stop_codon:yes gene_type:complete